LRELSCDEAVVRHFGETIKSSYALTLVSMEEKRSGLSHLCNNFSKNAIEERIIAIMKIKKTSLIAGLLAVALISGVTTVFATSAANASANPTNTNLRNNPLSEVKIGDNHYKEDSDMTVSDNKKISFDIQSIIAGENVKLGEYTLQKGDTVQVEYESSGNKISVFISTENASATAGIEIPSGTVYEIQQDGEYYFSIQNNAINGTSNNVKGIIQFSYLNPQMVQDERIQFTDDDIYPNESQPTDNESSYDGIFDDSSTVLDYYSKKSFTADSYQENIGDSKASLMFTNFAGSKAIYELNFEQATTVDFTISADVDGEYKIAFINGNNEVVITASSFDWLQASRPIEVPKGKTIVALIGEKATGGCNITLDY